MPSWSNSHDWAGSCVGVAPSQWCRVSERDSELDSRSWRERARETRTSTQCGALESHGAGVVETDRATFIEIIHIPPKISVFELVTQ